MSDAALSLTNDLRSGGLKVRLPVGGVVVLVGVEIGLRMRGVKLSNLAESPVGALARIGQHQLGAQRPEDELALLAGVGGQAELYLVASGGADHGVADARVPAGRVEDGLPRGESAGALAFQNDVPRRAVLDGSPGIREFELQPDLDAGQIRGAVQPDQRRVADLVQKIARVRRLDGGTKGVRRRRRLPGPGKEARLGREAFEGPNGVHLHS